ncbi:MAG: DUF1009 domain-containing protein, partial [Magnetococcales bacterium]|nr:DUF1009 domain-containing protein [Magnetococcales bacterium]
MSARVGLVAGSGQLPLLFARAMRRESESRLVAIVAHEGESDPALAECADQFLWVKLGQFERILRFLREQGA